MQTHCLYTSSSRLNSLFASTRLCRTFCIGLLLLGAVCVPAHAQSGRSAWIQQQKLTAPDGDLFDGFGYSVSVNGATAAIGAGGAVYMFTQSGTAWTLQQKVFVPATSVSLSGDTVIIGNEGTYIGSSIAQGAAYVFTRSGTTWTQQQELTASDGAQEDHFGNSVSLSGNTAVIGAVQKNLSQGAVYVFTRSGTTWTQQQELTASDGATGYDFGVSVSVNGATALIGAVGNGAVPLVHSGQGAAYVFTRSGTTWTQQQELTASDGADNDTFGQFVCLNGAIAIIGAPSKNIAGGVAYVFTKSGTTWTQQQELTASDGAPGDAFGYSISVSGNTAVIAAANKNTGQGAAYVFTRSGTTWSQQQELTASDAADGAYFGSSVSVNGDTAVIGASGGNPNQGSAYVFTTTYGNLVDQVNQVVTNPAVKTILANTLLAAETAAGQGNKALTDVLLRLFVIEVSIESGRAFSAAEAAILIQQANALMI